MGARRLRGVRQRLGGRSPPGCSAGGAEVGPAELAGGIGAAPAGIRRPSSRNRAGGLDGGARRLRGGPPPHVPASPPPEKLTCPCGRTAPERVSANRCESRFIAGPGRCGSKHGCISKPVAGLHGVENRLASHHRYPARRSSPLPSAPEPLRARGSEELTARLQEPRSSARRAAEQGAIMDHLSRDRGARPVPGGSEASPPRLRGARASVTRTLPRTLGA